MQLAVVAMIGVLDGHLDARHLQSVELAAEEHSRGMQFGDRYSQLMVHAVIHCVVENKVV
jgi:hypothetical protein